MAYRLAGFFILLLLVLLGALSLKILSTQKTLLNSQVSAFGQTITKQFAASVTEPLFTDDQTTLEVLTANLVMSEQVNYAVITDRSGNILAQAGVDDESSNRVGKIFTAPVEFQSINAGEVVVQFSAVEISKSIQATLKTVLILLLLMLLSTLLGAMFISRRIAKPVTQLVKATEQIGAGDYDVHLSSPYTDEVGQMTVALSRMAEQLKQKQQLESLFSRVVADDVAKTLMADMSGEQIATVEADASVLFVDIVGFTSLSENRSSEQVVALLNEYFNYFTLCSRLFFGSVDKFIGDCAMIVFGVPEANDDHRFNAIACAVTIQRLLQRLRQEHEAIDDMPPVHVKIGINSGVMMAGTIGAKSRMEYTVIGDAVNVASRLSDIAGSDEIWVGEATLNSGSLATRVDAEVADSLAVKGKQDPITAYRINGVMAEQQHSIETLIDDLLAHR